MATEAPKSNINPADLQKENVSVEDLTALLQSQGDLIAELTATIAEQKEAISDLRTANANAKPAKAVAAAGTFTVGKKEYRVKHGLLIRRDGGLVKISAEDILKDKELREKLVASRSNAVEAV